MRKRQTKKKVVFMNLDREMFLNAIIYYQRDIIIDLIERHG